MVSELPLLLTVDELVPITRCGRSALYEAIRTGQLPSIRIGRRIRVPRAALARMLGEPETSEEPVT